ncbi:HIRAN domain-containing protein [Arthrobacter sp. zg-Y1110]|uniref:HIRAN domain-containing protein n=1 Tax=Arthrobacter sp. zg-Y1110 TaxID=2886932 RepID=UPI001D15BAE6|nr:HIRAN domain-containing protein [Arthrobacter sp. zg-Y1110]MCC3291258.1 HIRAN domain-containing protein [Arthrobacter sp. zg-Y1110]UWX83684.1 HIRAN domain-containing protein [Arthrobacter sp. zg-Y1110]
MSTTSSNMQGKADPSSPDAGKIIFDVTVGMVVIPWGPAHITAAAWGDALDTQREFITLELTSPGEIPPAKKWVRTLVELVPRPDNTYNSNAISVAQPYTYGGTAEDRHMGYVPEASLAHLGGSRFSELAARARSEFGAPVACHARVRGGDNGEIQLCLPNTSHLHTLIDAALCRPKGSAPSTADQQRPRDTFRGIASHSSADTLEIPPARTYQAERLDAHALQQLANWRLLMPPAAPSEPVSVQQRSVFGKRRAYVVNKAGGRIGKIHNGIVFLHDECYRPAALEAAAASGLDLTGSPNLTGEYPPAVIKDEGTRWSINVPSDVLPLGWYEPELERLHVHASVYRQPALTLLARLGVIPNRVVWSAPPPQVYLSIGEVKEPIKALDVPSEIPPEYRRIWAHHSQVLPKEIVNHSPLNFTAGKPDPEYLNRTTDFLLDSYADTGYLDELFGPYSFNEKGNRPTPCRLCGYDALPVKRKGERDAEWLAYCVLCLRHAVRGFYVDLGWDEPWEPLAVWALAELATEIGGAPSQAQVSRLPPTTSPTAIDRALLVRMHVPRVNTRLRREGAQQRAPYTWFDWLAKADIVQDGYRTSRGIMSTARDGHVCRSLLERHIDDFFTANSIAHEAEPHWPYDPDLNPNAMRADWLLWDGTYVEAWGLPDEEKYIEKMQKKIRLAAKHGIRLVGVTPQDLGRLEELFSFTRSAPALPRSPRAPTPTVPKRAHT